MDIFSYVNSKFVYVERHIRIEINRLYHDVLTQRCRLEQQVFRNTLTLATHAPDEFAYHLMKSPGYMSVTAGEVVHIIQCIPVEVKYRKTEECYLQLPVTRGNQSYFLSPRTHILTKSGTQTNCNSLIPSMYLFGETWYKLIPNPVESIAPTIIKPLTKVTWKYQNPSSLATSGIYSQSDLDRLRDHIMFPAEKPMILNSLAREISGRPTVNQGISLTNLFNEEIIDKIAESAWGRFWTLFINFGTTSAGLIGLIIIIRGIKIIADTIIHGYALHNLFGWSFHLLGAFWDSVTNLLLHLGTRQLPRRPTKTDKKGPDASAPRSDTEERDILVKPVQPINTGNKQNDTQTTLYPLSQLAEASNNRNYSIDI